MIEEIPGLPDSVLGLKASGKVTAEDYQQVLVPAIESKLKAMKRVRLLYVLGEEFGGYTGAAAWEDAKVGVRHLTHFERVAVVTDVDWIERTVKAFGFMMPGDIRVFENDELQSARDWISEPPPEGKLSFELLVDRGVLILRPQGELEAADFKRVADEIDPFIEEKGGLTGLLIVAGHFPGWDDLSAFTAHFRFLREHHRHIRRLAVVTDDRLMSVMPKLASHFLVPEVRLFPAEGETDALDWAGGENSVTAGGS